MSSDTLKRITALSRLMIEQQSNVDRLEQELSAAKQALLRTKREDLPELMAELGLSEIKLDTGEKLSLKEDVSAAIPAAQHAAAMRWLAEKGYDGIVKTQLVVQYPRGEHETALEHAQRVAELTGHEAQLSETIHPQTLRAFVREQMANGQVVPFDLFGVVPYTEAKITKR